MPRVDHEHSSNFGTHRRMVILAVLDVVPLAENKCEGSPEDHTNSSCFSRLRDIMHTLDKCLISN